MRKTHTNIYHSELGRILSSRKRAFAINQTKNLLEFNDLCEVSETLSKSIKPLNFTFFGNPFPETLEEFGKGEMLFRPLTLENEFKWTFISIRKFSKQISIFLILKKDFEKLFLLGDYINAESKLNTILKEFGYSIWYIEAKFLLYEYQDRSEEQKEFLSEINTLNKNLFVGTLAHFLSFRTEKNLSAYKYDYDIKALFSRSKKDDERDVRQYYSFRLNYYENYNLDDFSMLLVFENCNSLIDRYLLSRDILKILSLNKDTLDFAYSKSLYLYRKTKDQEILPILVSRDINQISKQYFDSDYTKILDLYYTGLYEETIEEIRKYIVKNPSNFDLLIIYIRCHKNLMYDFQPIFERENSLINQITLKIYSLMSEGSNRTEIIYNLYQIGKNILSFDISPSLNNFIKNEENVPVNNKLKLLSINKFDPYFSKIYKNNNDGIDFLKKGLNHYNGSTSLTQWIKFLSNEIQDENLLNKETLSKEIFSVNKAKIMYNNGDYENSVIEWKKILLEFSFNTPILQTSLKYLFDCYVKMNDFNIAIKLYVNQYIENENAVIKINSNNLLIILRKLRYTNIRRTIDLPLFVYLCSKDDTEKSYVLEEFCKIHNAKLPSELLDLAIDEKAKKNELFYLNVCGSEILKHSIFLNNTIDRLNERLKIVNFLKDNFSSPEKNYLEELNIITNELIIYEGTLKLDESKIYANDQAIINYELKDIDGLFNRFKTIYNLSLKDKKILIISEKSFAFFKFQGAENYNKTEVRYSESALIEVFSELFDSILDRYLFSNFGIVAYLSTRIRHGVLLGELRPELEKQNLILNRVGDTDKYEKSKFWNSSFFGLTDKKKEELHNVLSKFSLNIDNLIDDIIKTKIQIKKDGINEKGLLNYEFNKYELTTFINSISIELDTKTYCQSIIDILWERTDANLEVIREYIDVNIKNNFSEELDKLDSDLRNIFKVDDLEKIFTNVIESSTIIENKVKKISSWFRRSGSTINDFDIQKVFEIVWKNTEKCYPKINAKCAMHIRANPTIRSSYYIHFTDLFRILLDNMFKYGIEINGKKELEFYCTEENGFLRMKFINTVENIKPDLPFKINKDGQLLLDTNKLLSEGKSGITKAIKIVKYDFDNERNYIEVLSEESEKFEIIVNVEVKNLLQNEDNSYC